MSKKALISVNGIPAAICEQQDDGYYIQYLNEYTGQPISLTMPVTDDAYYFEKFPAFFDGLLPEGPQLHALLKTAKIDADDYFMQLIQVGHDLVGAVTVEAIHD